jgi:hypothetical protein
MNLEIEVKTMQKKYAQLQTLSEIFDISQEYFRKRMHGEFKQGIHFFIPPSQSRTKKIVLWDITAVEKWLKENDSSAANLIALSIAN